MNILTVASDMEKPRRFGFASRRKRLAAMLPSQLRTRNWKQPLLAALLLAPSLLFAQQYSIDWYKIAGGGGTSTGGVFTVSGTIGQPDASGAMTGGNFSLTGGFWSLYAVQTPGAPTLTIQRVNATTVKVQWPYPSTGWTLQQNPNLATTSWSTSSGVANDGTNNFLNLPSLTGNLFFRLKQ